MVTRWTLHPELGVRFPDPQYYFIMVEQVNIPLGINHCRDISRMSFAKTHEFPYQGLWIFSGAQGTGKTLTMMHVLYEMHRSFPDAIIVSNISVYGIPTYPYSGLSDFDRYANGEKGCIFVIDEIHSLFSSLESAGMSPAQIQVWSQNRKNRRVILGTSQRFNRVAKPLREQCAIHYQCLKHIPIINLYRYRAFDASEYDESGVYQGEPQPMQFYCPRHEVLTKFSTLEVVKRNVFN